MSARDDLGDLTGLSYVRIRALARAHATATDPAQAEADALACLAAPDEEHRMLAVWLLGEIPAARHEHLTVLRERAVPDASWRVQEALAQAFDAFSAATGYEAALPTIDAWLAGDHPNARRAVSEGLRPWTARSRPYFAAHPEQAISRLAALRADPSDYVRHSAGNALRDIRRTHPALVDAETARWNSADPREAFTYARVLKAH